MRGSMNPTVDKGVFGVAVAISVAFLLWGVLAKDNLIGVTSAVLDYVVANFGWVFILASFGFLVFAVYLAFRISGEAGRLR